MASTFFTSDLHLFHHGILTYEEVRSYATVEEMHEAIIDNWNKEVRPSDTVVVTGDVCFGGNACWDGMVEIFKRLHGRKELVMGNHDEKIPLHILASCFSRVLGVKRFDRCVVTHIPVHPGQFERYTANIHGHLHSKRIHREDGSVDPRYINVCLEQWNMTPVEWSELEYQVKYLRKFGYDHT